MPGPELRHLLILGGTAEAAALARLALDRFGAALRVTSSLAGRTEHPAPLPGAVRIGGFGGAEGLRDYLAAAVVDLVVDATHPFAVRISAQARLACTAAGVPRLQLLRPPWQRHPGDRWIEVTDSAGAAHAVPRLGRRALLTAGAGDLAAFAEVIGVHFVVRLVEAPRTPLPLRSAEVLIGRGPFTLAAERLVFRRHDIDVLVCKASGGAATEAKLVAARELGLPVVMMRRPPPEPGPLAEDVATALDWIAAPWAAPPLASHEETA